MQKCLCCCHEINPKLNQTFLSFFYMIDPSVHTWLMPILVIKPIFGDACNVVLLELSVVL